MVTLQAGNLVPVSFDEMVDPKTNRTRIRMVDLDSYTYSVARAYMIRLEVSDFEVPEKLAAIASAANMKPKEFQRRYEYVVRHERRRPNEQKHAPAECGCS